MRTVLRILVGLVGLVMTATLLSPAAAADARPRGATHARIVPVDRVAGSTGGRIVGDWFVENLSRPKTESPFAGSADLCLDLGRHDRVLVPTGGVRDAPDRIEISCTVRVGRSVVLVMTSADCSTAEPEPFLATTARAQRRCVVDALNSLPITSIDLSVDGSKPVDIHRPRFFEVSSQRHVVFPSDPVFDATPGPATFVAAAWAAQVKGLERGSHRIEGVTTYDDGFVDRFVVHLDVVRGKGHRR